MKLLRYKDKTFPLTEEEAENINSFLVDAKKGSHFEFKGQSLKTINAEVINKEEIIDKEKSYDIDTDEDRQKIKRFEREIKEAEKWELENDMDFYGEPVSTIPAFRNKQEVKLRDGLVNNEILGLCHWSLVAYCLKNFIIGRKKGNSAILWSVRYPNGKDYFDKMASLSALMARRTRASQYEKQEIDKLEEDKESLINEIPF